jgi:hypothetical protein
MLVRSSTGPPLVSHRFSAALRLFPGMTGVTVRAFLGPPTRGVVLETFGAGNAPQRTDLMAALKQACDSGIVVVAITQCAKGSVSDVYETGRTLQQAGVVPGGDMTPEVHPLLCREWQKTYVQKHSVPSRNLHTFYQSPN